MQNFTIRQIIKTHQPVEGTPDTMMWCRCGEVFGSEHQLDMLEADGHDTQA